MTEATQHTKRWEGQVVDGAFPLKKLLGETEHSAVFLTEYGEGARQKAAIKLVSAETEAGDRQLLNWDMAKQLSHPNLLKLLQTGRCRIENYELFYLVMEFAEENLADILPQRALTQEETRDMLCPVLDALEYLHGKGFVHGDLKPANILASGDRLKLSSDTILRIGESQNPPRKAGVYDPPEAISGMLTAASDVWSLGTTLVEVMTQRLPDWQPGPEREPVVPGNLSAPFQEIARLCLRLEPQRRASIASIAARLNARAAAASASAVPSATLVTPGPNLSAVGGNVTLSTPKPVASTSVPPRAAARMQTSPHRPPPYKGPGTKSRFIVPLAIGALVFAAVLTVPGLLTHRPKIRYKSAVTAQQAAGKALDRKPSEAAASSRPKAKRESGSAVSETSRSPERAKQQTAAQTSQPASLGALKVTSEKTPPVGAVSPNLSPRSEETGKAASAGIVSARGDVLDQVLPDVPQKARDTIRGRVRVGIKVHVNAAGAVSDAQIDSVGPSRYFADWALDAAKKWVFTPPEVNGKSVESTWNLRFVFTQGDTKVTPTQITP